MADQNWLVEGSPSLLLVLDESLSCCGMADAWRARLPRALAEQSAIPAEVLFDFESAPGLLDQFRSLVADGPSIVDTPVGIQLDDGTLQCRFGAWRAQRAADQPSLILVAATDVSKYQDAMSRLTQLQTQHQVILDAAGEGIYGLDGDGRVTFGNAATTDIVGWRAEEMIGQKSHDVHHHSYSDGSPYPRDNCPIYAALTDGEVHRVESEVFWHANGSAVPVEYTSTPIIEDGRPAGAVVVFRDISERRRLEQDREAAFEEIQRLKNQLEQERDYLREEISVAASYGEIVGESEALRRTLAQIESVAETPASVLILGESGVGKEAIARAIHTKSPRADRPLVKVNCASIPKDLFESEFFGHVRGAFTGAHQERVGRLQLADGGTLFLDEVGEIPLSQQGKLLRALQEREFERVGDDKTTRVDVRVIAATNRNLTEEVEAGNFREDLYYRLSVFPVEVPPLRHRLDDIQPLVMHFLKTSCSELGREPLQVTRTQIAELKRHSWPGNIRELKNVIERAVISSRGSRLRLDLAMPSAGVAAPVSDTSFPETHAEFVTAAEFKELEKANIRAALEHAQWKTWGPGGAAELLGINPSTLAYRMKTLGLTREL